MNEHRYLQLLQQILEEGEDKKDRTGVGTKSLFGTTLRFDLTDNKIPLLTTKKMFWKGVVEELLFFINGKTQTKELEEKGVKIWTGNTSKEFIKKLPYPANKLNQGDMGKMYGYNWRKYGSREIQGEAFYDQDCDEGYTNTVYQPGIDQLQNVFNSLKENPNSRRHLVIATDPHAEEERVLPECHYAFQFYVSNGNELSIMFNMRSSDAFLGLPMNLASYGLLCHLFAAALGYKAKELIYCGGDVHIYNNLIEQSKLQISRTPHDFPKLKINKYLSSLQDIENIKFDDLELINYQCHPAIKGQMAI